MHVTTNTWNDARNDKQMEWCT